MDRKEKHNKQQTGAAYNGYFFPADPYYDELAENGREQREAVRQAAAEAIGEVYGVLGLVDIYDDVVRSDEDLSAAVNVHISKEGGVKIEADIIADVGWDTAELVREVAENVTDAVEEMAQSNVCEVLIDVADIMPRGAFEDKYRQTKLRH